MNKPTKITPQFYNLLILLAAIFLDEILDNYFLGVFNSTTMLQKAVFYGLFLFLQIIASPIQAGFSDFYCRKKSLITSLCVSTVSLVFVFLYYKKFFPQLLMLSIATLLKGMLGNTLPLAWAGIADTQNRDYRFSLGLSTSIIAIGYLALLIIDAAFPDQNLYLLSFCYLYV